MALHIENFRRQIFGCATETVSLVLSIFEKLSKPKVSKTNVSVLVHQYIFRFQVSVDNLVAVQIAKRKDNLGRNELDSWLAKPLDLVEVVVNVASRHILQKEVNPQLVLKHIVHRVDKRVICLEQDFLFNFDVLHLVLL